jgi:hypothetical protein
VSIGIGCHYSPVTREGIASAPFRAESADHQKRGANPEYSSSAICKADGCSNPIKRGRGGRRYCGTKACDRARAAERKRRSREARNGPPTLPPCRHWVLPGHQLLGGLDRAGEVDEAGNHRPWTADLGDDLGINGRSPLRMSDEEVRDGWLPLYGTALDQAGNLWLRGKTEEAKAIIATLTVGGDPRTVGRSPRPGEKGELAYLAELLEEPVRVCRDRREVSLVVYELRRKAAERIAS